MDRRRARIRSDSGAVGAIEAMWTLPLALTIVVFMVFFAASTFTWFAAKHAVNEGTRRGALLLAADSDSAERAARAEDNVRGFLESHTEDGRNYLKSVGDVTCRITKPSTDRSELELLGCTVGVRLNLIGLSQLGGVNPELTMRGSTVVEANR